MGKESVVMPILKQMGIAHSYNFDSYDGYVINCVVAKKICKIRETSNNVIIVEFPMDERETKTFTNKHELIAYLRTPNG